MYDGAEDPAGVFQFGGDPTKPHDTGGDPVIAGMSYIAKSLMSLSPRSREIVLDRLAYPTRSLRHVADRLGISIQAAHYRLKKARAEWPALAYAVTMKSWRNIDSVAFGEDHEQGRDNVGCGCVDVDGLRNP